MADVAAIVEAEVSRSWSGYDKRTGPRTFYELSNIVVVAGKAPSKAVFSQLGGVEPDGSRTVISELKTYSVGSRYVFFFGKQASMFTAIWAGLAFRIEKVGAREVAFGPDGNVVLSFGVGGVKLGSNLFLKKEQDARGGVEVATFDRTAASVDAEVGKAPALASLLEDAVAATTAMGGPLGENVELDVPANERWDEAPVAPALEAK